jgi:hypothetical protein
MTAPQEPINPSELFSPFLSTTYNIPEEEDRGKTFLQDQLCNFSDVINDKKIGLYAQLAENFNGEKWFYKTTQVTRNGYQTICYIPSFPVSSSVTLTGATFPIPKIDPDFVVTQAWGSASKPPSTIGAGNGDYFSFYGSGNSKISFTMSDTSIIITTSQNMSAYSGFIVIQYLKDGV